MTPSFRRLLRPLLLLALFAPALPAPGALAQEGAGFAVRDLTALEAEAKALLGPSAIARAAPERLTLVCSECPGAPTVDVLLGRQTDGTEARVRSGETPIARLEEQCRAREPSCRIERLEMGPAVGWISRYRLGATGGSTAVILRNGDLMTIRALAADADAARRTAGEIATRLGPRVVGR